ncbi:MAG: hypothetical protein J6C50_01235, partial [Rickettsiales bacterium]|nr:hypothetical protein [Rickettsiales bacterium]
LKSGIQSRDQKLQQAEQKIEQQKKQLITTNSENARLKSGIQSRDQEILEQKQQLEDLQQQLEAKAAALAEAQQGNKTQTREIARLKKEIEQQKQQLEEAQQQLKQAENLSKEIIKNSRAERNENIKLRKLLEERNKEEVNGKKSVLPSLQLSSVYSDHYVEENRPVSNYSNSNQYSQQPMQQQVQRPVYQPNVVLRNQQIHQQPHLPQNQQMYDYYSEGQRPVSNYSNSNQYGNTYQQPTQRTRRANYNDIATSTADGEVNSQDSSVMRTTSNYSDEINNLRRRGANYRRNRIKYKKTRPALNRMKLKKMLLRKKFRLPGQRYTCSVKRGIISFLEYAHERYNTYLKNGNEEEYFNNLEERRDGILATLDSQSKRNAFIAQYNAIVALGPVRYSRMLRELNSRNGYSKNGFPLKETFMKIWKMTQVRQKNLNNKNNNYFAYLLDGENEALSEQNSFGPSTEPLPNPWGSRTELLNQSEDGYSNDINENSLSSALEDASEELKQKERNTILNMKSMVEAW